MVTRGHFITVKNVPVAAGGQWHRGRAAALPALLPLWHHPW